MKKTLLVTGGCGFIGSNFIRHIINKYPGYKIINLDKLTYCGNPDNLKDMAKDSRYKFVKGDICDYKLAKKISHGCDAILNFAAETHVDRSIKDASDFIHTNVRGTQALLEAARENKIPRYVQISTDEVYGSIEKGSFRETDPLHPNSPYAASKAAGDHLCLAYHTTYKVPVIITRSSNNFGPYQFPEKVIPLFITNLLDGKKIPLYGDGLNVRDWLYVVDNCEAIDLVLHKGKVGEIYNISSNHEIPNITLTKTILRLLGKSEKHIQYVKDRLGHDRRYSLNSSKVRRLGWHPRHSFAEALSYTVSWYSKNRRWWEKLSA